MPQDPEDFAMLIGLLLMAAGLVVALATCGS